ncbi:uncharacterized protein KQ657_002984 [Scheffersomyces spartinae]|uniref:Peptide hydrolase n=1 Tax=Scheffersomyces spartinae TaxID=45513 RepID=A0A9P8AGD1_9ASCO|nr:uncharacterized protein KQ657_002984 [Scheffersomyces spartinae]KAG7191589.1 hypothetical protein KQ657_002984 [Scheffersomyces spartinae]
MKLSLALLATTLAAVGSAAPPPQQLVLGLVEESLGLNVPFKGEPVELDQSNLPNFWDYWRKPFIDTEQLQALITESGLRSRAETLFNISKGSIGEYGHPTRVIGSQGHWGTIHYILDEIRSLGYYYDVWTQKFNAIDGRVKLVSLLLDGVKPKSLEALSLTPPTPNERPVHGNLVLVDGFGCLLEDFPKSVKDNIVLIKRGLCAFNDKSVNAGLLGAVGAIIYDPAGGLLHGTLGEPTGKEVATVSISKEDAQPYIDSLLKDPLTEIETTLYVDSYVKNVTTLNVIAETRFGDHNNVVSLGAHSDSVEAGPGINDDGSGTISLLEVAKSLSHFKVKNAVRFAWWAAEEEGLLGSTYYSEHLSPVENQKVRLFMDYDMMASPNYEYEVYDANNKDHPAGSEDLKQLYIDWYVDHGLNYTLIPFDGRSDYVGFIDAGIPAGGIATGAEVLKGKKSWAKFGGTVGDAFDPCYHLLCDDLGNPDYGAWVINTKLIAHSVATYAKTFDGFPERSPINETITATSNTPSDSFKYRGSKLII